MTDATDGPGSVDGSDARSDGGATARLDPTAHSEAAPGDRSTVRAESNASETATRYSAGTARQVVRVARREYRVLARERWLYGLALLFGVFSLSVVALADSAAGSTSAGALLVTLAELSVYLVPLAALALGYGTVVGAGERGTLETLLSVPLARSLVLVGKFLGRAATFAVGTALGLGVGAVAVGARFGVAVLPAYLHYLLTAVAVGVAFLALAVCLSAATTEKARALGGALAAWVWFVLVYDLAALGVVVAVDPPGWLLTVLVLANPADVLRLVVLSLVPTTGGGVGAVLATTAVPAPAILVGLTLWVVVPVAVAGRMLESRG